MKILLFALVIVIQISSIDYLFSMLQIDKNTRVVYETEIEAGIAEVWQAFTTKAGLQSWMAPLVEINLIVGGKIKTDYDPEGTIGDENTIENTILAYVPGKMISLKATRFPPSFSYQEIPEDPWTVFYFEEITPTKTNIMVVGLGYTQKNKSQQLNQLFFDANKQALDKLKYTLAKGNPPENLDNKIEFSFPKLHQITGQQQMKTINKEQNEVYRLTFHDPGFTNGIIILLEKCPKQIKLSSWKVNLPLYYKNHDSAILKKEKYILEKEWADLITKLDKLDFWNYKSSKKIGFDGSFWILEGALKEKYHKIEEWSPNKDSFLNLCYFILGLADLGYGRSKNLEEQ